MKHTKKVNLFEIGSLIDSDNSWSFIEDKQEKKEKILLPKEHNLFFKKERRRGKVVTLVGEFFIKKEDAKEILSELKKTLGVGGSFKDNFFEFQGEWQDRLKELFKSREFRFKK